MGRVIYVSSVNGDDANSGYAPEKAFRSLRKVNQMEIQPGDQILLERGSVFIGEYLHLYAGGTKEAPVVVDAYGECAISSSWVIITIVCPYFFAVILSRAITSSLVLESRFPVGSSANIISGRFTSALAIATLCCCPPDN